MLVDTVIFFFVETQLKDDSRPTTWVLQKSRDIIQRHKFNCWAEP